MFLTPTLMSIGAPLPYNAASANFRIGHHGADFLIGEIPRPQIIDALFFVDDFQQTLALWCHGSPGLFRKSYAGK
jgi:hypothetical protein